MQASGRPTATVSETVRGESGETQRGPGSQQQELELRVTAQVDMAKRFLDNLKTETLHNLKKMRKKSNAKITKHLVAMEAQLNKVQKECRQMLNVERFSNIEIIASVRRLRKLFITDANKELEAFCFTDKRMTSTC